MGVATIVVVVVRVVVSVNDIEALRYHTAVAILGM
jgi:hypothetical protein